MPDWMDRIADKIQERSVGTSPASVGLTSAMILSGKGSPNNVVKAPVGALYVDITGGAGTTLYVKESGNGNSGWVGK